MTSMGDKNGQRSLKTTLKYIQLVDVPQEERFISKVAVNVKEATELIELGFEYVTGEYSDGGKIFRKRKISYLGSGSVPGGSWSSMEDHRKGDISRTLSCFSFYLIKFSFFG
jgi:hypothetical protein